MIATTADQLRQLVKIYSQFDSFVFDLETVYTPTAEEQIEFDRISDIKASDRTIDEAKWFDIHKLRATDPYRNEVIWIGMATYGRSDSVATGHPKGTLVSEAHEVSMPACEAYELDDSRRLTPTGKVSTRMVKVKHPATFTPPPAQLRIGDAVEILEPLFFSDRRKINQNLKFDIKSLAKYYEGRLMPEMYADLAIGQHILNENIFTKYSLENMVKHFLAHEYDKLGSKGVHNFSFEKAAKYAEQDCKFTWLLWKRIERQLQKLPELWNLHEWEMNQLYGVLMRQEYHGALVDMDTMRQLRQDFQAEADALIDRLIVEYGAPEDFNPNSTDHKRALLYDTFGGKVTKLTDGGKDGKNKKPSVDAEAIQAVANDGGVAGEVAEILLDHADRNKDISTYLVGMGMRVDQHGYLHPDFVQYGTDTGRLSCVTGETPVLTARGPLPIVDVVVGDQVLTHEGRWRDVVAYLDQGVRNVVVVHTASGEALTCTEDHRLYTPNGWMYVRDLYEGAEIYDASIEALYQRPGERTEGVGVVSLRSGAHVGRDRSAVGDPLLECAADRGGSLAGWREVHTTASPPQSSHFGGTELDVRPTWRTTSPIHGDCRHGGWIPVRPQLGREASQSTSPCVRSGTRARSLAGVPGSSSHRWEQAQQRAGQLGTDNEGRTLEATFPTTHVVAVVAGGERHVYDLTVDEDASYVAGGFINHNCREPNLQNIPRESAMRDLFIAPPGFVMISADYDQIELRFLSKYAKDTGLQEVFLSGEDVHTATAAKVMKCDVSEVDSENRTLKGKMPNFLIGYGGSHILLARKTGITEDEAKEVLEEYFAAFSRINPWKAHVLKKARENAVWRDGKMVVPPYVTTMMKRRRRLPDLNIITRGLSKNEWRLANKRVMRAERQAVNAVVQGSAAETTKLAMIDIDAYARREGFPLRMVINVHDEIVALCPEDCAEEGLSVMRSCMESVVNPLTGKKPLNDWVPLSAAGKVSDRWEKG